MEYLKNVRLKFDDNEEKTLRIEHKGEGEVTAGDIISDGTVEILNPDLHIATISEGGSLVMEMTADRGRGCWPILPSCRSRPKSCSCCSGRSNRQRW